ncbi:phage SPO1 DNA polymerase domain protein [Pseudogulbenkiania sp. NH8B]|uniref:uracil-DNA glycosylase n=1 Tax=Pseudogulbenkiania sp. (strain NH8B) TaxID=748280 RepID=UPI000227A233|nr:uracil-DNA glycosylase [Pseudogulbenkiania sp. NH8B]BAK78034.1 phage SPO1 DNA polymerase domain protein [Pseudogulbenkiania sp. NH8B]
MSRRHLIGEVIGLGPLWRARDARFDDHPARRVSPPAAPLADAPVEAATAETAPVPVAAAVPVPTAVQAATSAPAPAAPVPAVLTEQAAPSLPTPAKPVLSWDELEQTVARCSHCRLCETRTQTVFGRGNPQARWLIIGEAPGEQEDKQGKPFVGRAGQLLDNMLAAIGLDSNHDVYIANVLKCRPPGNRNPSADEIVACQDYLRQQIAHIRPTLILALGRFAAQTLLDSNDSIARLRGRVHRYQDVPLIVSFHPAYLLRNLPDKAKSWQDLVFARRTFRQLTGQ